MLRLSAILLLLGVVMIGYAYPLAPYKNETLLMERLMALSEGQDTEYGALRDEMLTLKFQLHDYGCTIIAIAVGVFLMALKGWHQLKSPASQIRLFGYGLAASLLSIGAYIFDLFQAQDRGEFPYWADSMGIPLMGVPFLFFISLVWIGLHLQFLQSSYQSVPLAHALSRQSSGWLRFVSSMTMVLVVWCVLLGQYWYAIPGIVWMYFYLSLAAAYRAGDTDELRLKP